MTLMAPMEPILAWLSLSVPLAASIMPPLVILVLCIVAGIGTVLVLPGRREAALRAIGGVILLVALLVFAAILIRQTARYTAGDVYFWIFSAIALLGAIRVISHPKPVYAALYFVLTVVASAGLFVLLWAEFMAVALVLIYAGAILVTYVFVIMLAQQVQTGTLAEAGAADYDQVSREPLIATAAGFTIMGVLVFMIFDRWVEVPPAAEEGFGSTMQGLGAYLFSRQMIAIELAALLLTLAMVGSIVIARRKLPGEPEQPQPLPPLDPGESDPHKIPVYGTANPEAKAYPEA